MQQTYPVFESGQVLTNAHLNQLSTWLNEQQRYTRSRLFGVGIVCGFQAHNTSEISSRPSITVTKGAALTSAGHLMQQERDLTYTQYRDYRLPVSDAPVGIEGSDNSSDEQTHESIGMNILQDISMRELLTDAFVPSPGESAPTALSRENVEQMQVLLLLESKQLALKNCDINDCADKGARQEYVLRTLLISTEDATRLWQSETQSNGDGQSNDKILFPSDLNWQALKVQLTPLNMPKLMISAAGEDSLLAISNQATNLVNTVWPSLKKVLSASFTVFEHVLKVRFPANVVNEDPWQSIDLSIKGPAQNEVALMQRIHAYDILCDISASYNEFLEVAIEYDALCCPTELRFAYHVMLGISQTPDAISNTEDLNFNIGAKLPSISMRHRFYPSPPLHHQDALSIKMQDLYYRCYLLCKRIALPDTANKPIGITPSIEQGHLSQKAIPYYYAMQMGDDLHRNWSPEKTRKQQLNRVYAHAFNGSAKDIHPLQLHSSIHDFYRVEGVHGKGLAQSIKTLNALKLRLGLDFAIEPVLLPLDNSDDVEARNQLLALLLKDNNLQRLFRCKTSDLDRLFMLVMAVIFQLLVALIYLLSRAGGSQTAAGSASVEVSTGDDSANIGANSGANIGANIENNAGANTSAVFVNPLVNDAIVSGDTLNAIINSSNLGLFTNNLNNTQVNTAATDVYLKQVRSGNLKAWDIIAEFDEQDDPNGVIGKAYIDIVSQPSSDIRSQLADLLKKNNAEVDVESSYQSVRMINHAEKLMAQSAQKRISEFDFDRFKLDLEELVNAHQALGKQYEQKETNAETQQFLASVNANMNMLTSLGNSAIVSTMQTALKERLEEIFEQYVFSQYRLQKPGLMHMCGVPKGGTLVLAYTPRSLLKAYKPPANKDIGTMLNAVADFSNVSVLANADVLLATPNRFDLVDFSGFANTESIERVMVNAREIASSDKGKSTNKRKATSPSLVSNLGELKVDESVFISDASRINTDKALTTFITDDKSKSANAFAFNPNLNFDFGLFESANTSTEKPDPLDEMIVVADFCLWHRCCDIDCSELEPIQEEEQSPPVFERPAPTQITVKGQIVGKSTKSPISLIRLIKNKPLVNAKLEVRDKKNKAVKVKMIRGAFTFSVTPGEYEIKASAPGYASKTDKQSITKALNRDVTITLNPSAKGKG